MKINKLKQRFKEWRINRLIKKIRKLGGKDLNLFMNYLRLKLNLITQEQFELYLYSNLYEDEQKMSYL